MAKQVRTAAIAALLGCAVGACTDDHNVPGSVWKKANGSENRHARNGICEENYMNVSPESSTL